MLEVVDGQGPVGQGVAGCFQGWTGARPRPPGVRRGGAGPGTAVGSADAAAQENMGWSRGPRVRSLVLQKVSMLVSTGSTNQAPVRRMLSRMSARTFKAFHGRDLAVAEQARGFQADSPLPAPRSQNTASGAQAHGQDRIRARGWLFGDEILLVGQIGLYAGPGSEAGAGRRCAPAESDSAIPGPAAGLFQGAGKQPLLGGFQGPATCILQPSIPRPSMARARHPARARRRCTRPRGGHGSGPRTGRTGCPGRAD